MITAIICSVVIGLLIGSIIGGAIMSPSDYPFSLEDFERVRRIRAEHDAMKFYIDLENMRRDNLRLASFPLYKTRNYASFEIQKLPRAESLKDAEEKYGKYWNVTDGIIGKLNETIDSVNKLDSLNQKT
jgi:hypothetical protein